jgi:hypothetical protein
MSTNPVNYLTAAQLRAAADLRDQIESLEAKLQALLSGGAAPTPRPTAPAAAPAPAKKKDGRKGKKGKRALSPEALERIREGQAKRWAKVRASKSGSPAPKPTKKKAAAPATSGKAPKRKMTAEGRARIQAAVKARWARVAAAKAAAGDAPKKKAGKRAGKKA